VTWLTDPWHDRAECLLKSQVGRRRKTRSGGTECIRTDILPIAGGALAYRTRRELPSSPSRRQRATDVSRRAADRVRPTRTNVVADLERAGSLSFGQPESASHDVVSQRDIRDKAASIRVAEAYSRTVSERVVIVGAAVRACLNNLIGILTIRYEHIIGVRTVAAVTPCAHDPSRVAMKVVPCDDRSNGAIELNWIGVHRIARTLLDAHELVVQHLHAIGTADDLYAVRAAAGAKNVIANDDSRRYRMVDVVASYPEPTLGAAGSKTGECARVDQCVLIDVHWVVDAKGSRKSDAHKLDVQTRGGSGANAASADRHVLEL